VLKIQKESVPDIQMITEAGLIGKIGFNSRGVGVCLNAIKAKGVDMQRIPVHLALRLVLESQTAADAVQKLEKFGVASSAHILIADPQTAVGMEVSSTTIEKLAADSRGVLSHTNHFKLQHAGVLDARLLEDSERRDARMQELAADLEAPSREAIFTLYQDEQNAPSAICRQEIGDSTLATLFNIIMDLREKKAEICLGRPLKVDEILTLSF
jgi:isopenicillin-N N-acyltransferase-like protein